MPSCGAVWLGFDTPLWLCVCWLQQQRILAVWLTPCDDTARGRVCGAVVRRDLLASLHLQTNAQAGWQCVGTAVLWQDSLQSRASTALLLMPAQPHRQLSADGPPLPVCTRPLPSTVLSAHPTAVSHAFPARVWSWCLMDCTATGADKERDCCSPERGGRYPGPEVG